MCTISADALASGCALLSHDTAVYVLKCRHTWFNGRLDCFQILAVAPPIYASTAVFLTASASAAPSAPIATDPDDGEDVDIFDLISGAAKADHVREPNQKKQRTSAPPDDAGNDEDEDGDSFIQALEKIMGEAADADADLLSDLKAEQHHDDAAPVDPAPVFVEESDGDEWVPRPIPADSFGAFLAGMGVEDKEVSSFRFVLQRFGAPKPFVTIRPMKKSIVNLQATCRRHTACRCWLNPPSNRTTDATREWILRDMARWALDGDNETTSQAEHEKSAKLLQASWNRTAS